METNIRAKASKSTLKRLALYTYLLENLQEQRAEYVSCTEIAREFDLEPTQVRKDFEATGEVGTSRVGFRVMTLLVRTRECLGWDHPRDAFLVGAGNLGQALLGYRDFEKCGLNIVAAFDRDPRKVGTLIFEKEVHPLTRLPELARKMEVNIGIITVPAAQAQKIVDLLVSCGILAIWNFSPGPLRIPKGIVLQNARLTQSLAVLTSSLARALKGAGRE
jgi:redox-sensing transcriptional repressor